VKLKFTAFLIILSALFAFQKIEYQVDQFPDYFPAPLYNFSNNPMDTNKVNLGLFLFYDGILSKDNSISCSACHSPFSAFGHNDHQLSHGIHDSIGNRNAPPLFNLAWQPNFMWDGAVNHLDMQALAPISSETEMGSNIADVVKRLQDDPFYRKRFYRAFQDSTVTGERLLKALSQFQLTLISANSKYDQEKKGQVEFTKEELKGYKIFQKNCNSCHQEPLFSTYEMKQNFIALDSNLRDYGQGAITKNATDSLLFKVPSLRNLEFSYPYMHDGRYYELEEILQHYTSKTVQEKFKANGLQKINLSAKDQTDLIAFLQTLNDKEFVFDRRHRFPRELLVKWKEE